MTTRIKLPDGYREIGDDGETRETWKPKGPIAVGRTAAFASVDSLLPEGIDSASLPPIVTPHNLRVTEFVLAGTFASDDPEDEAKVRALAREAAEELAAQHGITLAELEDQYRNQSAPSTLTEPQA